MKPSQGRVVFYVLESASGRPGETRSAEVSQVFDAELCNLQITLDGPNDAWASGESYPGWRGSVKHDEGKAPGTWHWPPRV